jgi:hypothetical protein
MQGKIVGWYGVLRTPEYDWLHQYRIELENGAQFMDWSYEYCKVGTTFEVPQSFVDNLMAEIYGE